MIAAYAKFTATYRGRDLESESGSDDLSVHAVRTMVRTYGQMPL